MEQNETAEPNNNVHKTKIIIIGGGMAGLSAAYHLTKNGVTDYKILEARGRIGGRIVQIPIGNEKVELGANWIHGVLGNPVYELAMQHGLVDIMACPKPHKIVAATEQGKQVPFATLHEIYEAYLCFLKRCEEYFISQYLPLRESTVSETILKPLRKVIPKDNLLVNHPVKQIKWNCNKKSTKDDSDSDDSDRTVIESPSTSRESSCEKVLSRHNVEVICDNDKKFIGDHVICTLPLGVLKHKVNNIFQPPLPDYKLEAIDRLLFGTVDKILLEYERPFLHPNITEVLLLWEPEMEKNDDISKNWYKKIYSFAKITETLILGWISGKEAEYMETLSNDIIIETCTTILRKFLNDPFIPKPKSCACTSWYSQQYTRGSYTAIAVGSSQLDIEYLAQPLYLDENESKVRTGDIYLLKSI
ncbi:hypothetical protein NQ314_006983 [Rhamnusium bicolor]|uniref:Amine oxidase domain-containing protein n=1 Tax=Rhamnusium bicolor TaxID=1586634 RepID=A0AAV8YVW0_9CUCU|nr:hypothetical protein NQ314_006983 [Rhamnusium bicolor]